MSICENNLKKSVTFLFSYMFPYISYQAEVSIIFLLTQGNGFNVLRTSPKMYDTFVPRVASAKLTHYLPLGFIPNSPDIQFAVLQAECY